MIMEQLNNGVSPARNIREIEKIQREGGSQSVTKTILNFARRGKCS
jgi:hypothetical protein